MIPLLSLSFSLCLSLSLSICQAKNPKEIRVNFSLAPLIPRSADPLLPWSAFGGRSAGLCWCVPVVAPLSGYEPGDRGDHTLEAHQGRAGANRLSDPSLASIDISYSIRGSVRHYGPTTCLSAGAERGVRILWNIPGDSSKSALLQWRPAPTTAAVSMPITVVWKRCGGGRARRPWGRVV